MYNNDFESLTSSQQPSILAEGQGSGESSKKGNNKKAMNETSGKFSYSNESSSNTRKKEENSSYFE